MLSTTSTAEVGIKSSVGEVVEFPLMKKDLPKVISLLLSSAQHKMVFESVGPSCLEIRYPVYQTVSLLSFHCIIIIVKANLLFSQAAKIVFVVTENTKAPELPNFLYWGLLPVFNHRCTAKGDHHTYILSLHKA